MAFGLLRRLPPQQADDAAFRAGRFGKDLICQFKAFGTQRLLPFDDGVEQQRQPFAVAKAVGLAVGHGGENREIVFVAENVDQSLGIGALGAHGGWPDTPHQTKMHPVGLAGLAQLMKMLDIGPLVAIGQRLSRPFPLPRPACPQQPGAVLELIRQR